MRNLILIPWTGFVEGLDTSRSLLAIINKSELDTKVYKTTPNQTNQTKLCRGLAGRPGYLLDDASKLAGEANSDVNFQDKYDGAVACLSATKPLLEKACEQTH